MNIEERRIDELLNARWPLDTALENFEFRYDAIEALLDALSAMRAERGEAREKLGECHAGYEILREELAAAREALEHAEIFFRRILVAYDNPIPIHAKNSLWRDRADYMAKCAKAGEERTRAALGKRGEG